MHEMSDMHVFRALIEGRHYWDLSVKRDRRGAALKYRLIQASRSARKDQDDRAVPQMIDCCLNRTWRWLRAINRTGTALLQEPRRKR